MFRNYSLFFTSIFVGAFLFFREKAHPFLIFSWFFLLLLISPFVVRLLYRRFVRSYYRFWKWLSSSRGFQQFMEKGFVFLVMLHGHPVYEEDELDFMDYWHPLDGEEDVGILCWKDKILFSTYRGSIDSLLSLIWTLDYAFKHGEFDFPENRPFEVDRMRLLLDSGPIKDFVHFIASAFPSYVEYGLRLDYSDACRRFFNQSFDLSVFFESQKNLRILFDFCDLILRRGYGEYTNQSDYRYVFVKSRYGDFRRLFMPFVYSSFSDYFSIFVSSYYFQYSFLKRTLFYCFYFIFIGLFLSFFVKPFLSFYVIIFLLLVIYDFLFDFVDGSFLFGCFLLPFLFSWLGVLIAFVFICYQFFMFFYDDFVNMVNLGRTHLYNVRKFRLNFE